MNSLDNFEPFDDLEDWSDNIYLFMDAMAHPPQNVDALWKLAKHKKENPKLLNNPASRLSTNPGLKSPKD